MSKNMKGLSKAFKYFSQMFEEEEEEEPEIQIGLPTDVKHVAHIGVDGPAASAPTWMDDFKSSPTSESAPAPTQVNGIANGQDSKTSKKHVKESQSRDLPKSSRRQPSTDSIGSMDSPPGSPTQKSKSNRRRQPKSKECSSPKGGESSNNPPNIPKKTRRKRTKESKEKTSKNGHRHGSDDGGGEAV